MAWPAPSPGRPLEAEGDLRSRGMTVLDRIRAYRPARPRHPNSATSRIKDEPTINIGHIHEGATGVNGAVKISTGLVAGDLTLTGGGVTFTRTATADAALITAIIANPSGYYVNFHSTVHAGGVIRGQLSKA